MFLNAVDVVDQIVLNLSRFQAVTSPCSPFDPVFFPFTLFRSPSRPPFADAAVVTGFPPNCLLARLLFRESVCQKCDPLRSSFWPSVLPASSLDDAFSRFFAIYLPRRFAEF